MTIGFDPSPILLVNPGSTGSALRQLCVYTPRHLVVSRRHVCICGECSTVRTKGRSSFEDGPKGNTKKQSDIRYRVHKNGEQVYMYTLYIHIYIYYIMYIIIYPPTPADARGSAPGNNTFDCSFGLLPQPAQQQQQEK